MFSFMANHLIIDLVPKQKANTRKVEYADELQQLRDYLLGSNNEDAKRPLLYPLFQKLFREKFKIESDAHGADVYVEGKLIVESKTEYAQWLEGFYQALHYQRRFGLAYNTIIVIAHKFIGIWKVNDLPEYAVMLSHAVLAFDAPSAAGKENARKTSKANREAIKDKAFYWLEPKQLEDDYHLGSKSLTVESYEILKILNNLESDRLQINTHNFIDTIEIMKSFFHEPINAVHAFYEIVAYWDITSTVAEKSNGNINLIGYKGNY